MIGVNAKPPVRKKLKTLRHLAGLTQSGLAKLVKTDSSTISDYERGVVMPSAARLRDIAAVLNVTTDEIDLGVDGAGV